MHIHAQACRNTYLLQCFAPDFFLVYWARFGCFRLWWILQLPKCVRVCVCMICVYICFSSLDACVCMFACICILACVCVCVCVCGRARACVCVCVCVCMRLRLKSPYAYVHIECVRRTANINTHTHTHTHLLKKKHTGTRTYVWCYPHSYLKQEGAAQEGILRLSRELCIPHPTDMARSEATNLHVYVCVCRRVCIRAHFTSKYSHIRTYTKVKDFWACNLYNR